MTGFLLELINVYLAYIPSFAIKLFPMWKTRDVKARSVCVFVACYALLICAGLLTVKQFLTLDLRIMLLYKVFISLPGYFLGFWAFRKRVWQNIFLITVSAMYGPISVGIGTYAQVNWFVDYAHPLLGANFVCAAVIALTLPPLLFLLRRLYENPNVEQRVWRIIWMLPTAFFWAVVLFGHTLSESRYKSEGFIVIRFITYGSLLLTCHLLDSTLRQASENIMLKNKARAAENHIAMQQEQYSRFMRNAETIKSIRHDFRHHIAVIKGFNNFGEGENLGAYIDELASVVSVHDDKILCENFAVNAVASHYLGIAESEGASVDAWLDIPEDTGLVSPMDLCVVTGNFLENAVEACRRMERGDKFIRVRARIEGDTLSIVVTNSFDGLLQECVKDGVYLSRKESAEAAREGLGLASVKSVCERYKGFAQYEITGGVWKSSALVHMDSS